MEHDAAAASLAELGNPHRLAIFRFLVKAGFDGATVGNIQHALEIPGSTLSHHLSRMAAVGLITQKKQGRSIICVPQYGHLQAVIEFLCNECCIGLEEEVVPALDADQE
ncbi:ArsR/SmtB family transcription factor [Cobetia sp. Ld8]|uniref:ArsR/SmtB family transcription factor n=1 Tax=Cobetia sp. Ld8 TaxID=649154 RepID=UPI001DB8C08A|nr:helix-turn-helix transcriptional regulator [Gammaproteobacteria bacterium]